MGQIVMPCVVFGLDNWCCIDQESVFSVICWIIIASWVESGHLIKYTYIWLGQLQYKV